MATNNYVPDYVSNPVKSTSKKSTFDIDAYQKALNELIELANQGIIYDSKKSLERGIAKNISEESMDYLINNTHLTDVYNDYSRAVKKYQAQLDITNLQNAFAELGIGAPQQLNAQGLSSDYQTYLDQLNELSGQQYAVAMDELNRSENEMYRAIGMSQRQMERDIAKRRQQALKSGMSTAQLAAQEQQNLLAAQTGATQIAQNYANQRYNTINQYATANQQNYTNVLGQQLEYNNARQQNWDSVLANTYAQIYAADKYQK